MSSIIHNFYKSDFHHQQMPMGIDRKVDEELIQQLALRIEASDLSPVILAHLKENFNGSHSKEFYEGLVSGYFNAYNLAADLPKENIKNSLGFLAAFVADHLRNYRGSS